MKQQIYVSCKFQLFIIFRNILNSGKPVERFWAFANPEEYNAPALRKCIKDALARVLCDK